MNVLIQNPYISAGGAESRIKSLINELVGRYDIDSVYFIHVVFTPSHRVDANGKLHFWQVEKKNVARVTGKIIDDYNIDIFQLHNNQMVGTHGLNVARERGIPTIWVMHDMWVLCHQRFMTKVWQAMDYDLCHKIDETKCRECVGDFNYELTAMQREDIKKCDVAIMPSNRIKKIFEDNGVLNGKMRIIKPWINLGAFRQMPEVNKDLWKVFFAGNYIPHKGIQVLLKAWKLVNKRLPMANLVAQGDQRSVQSALSLAKVLNLQNVSFIPHVSQEKLCTLYNEASITVFPTIWEEIMGLIWVESLACGTPVICSEIGSIPEYLKYGGEMFEPRNHVELATKIIDLLLSPSKRNEYGKDGFNYVRREFNPARAANDFVKLYYELSDRK